MILILESALGAHNVPNFRTLFAKPGVDLLCPGGEYIGIKATKDDERSELESTTNLSSMLPDPPSLHPLNSTATASHPDGGHNSDHTTDLDAVRKSTSDGPGPSAVDASVVNTL